VIHDLAAVADARERADAARAAAVERAGSSWARADEVAAAAEAAAGAGDDDACATLLRVTDGDNGGHGAIAYLALPSGTHVVAGSRLGKVRLWRRRPRGGGGGGGARGGASPSSGAGLTAGHGGGGAPGGGAPGGGASAAAAGEPPCLWSVQNRGPRGEGLAAPISAIAHLRGARGAANADAEVCLGVIIFYAGPVLASPS